jgi:hypothetical protein
MIARNITGMNAFIGKQQAFYFFQLILVDGMQKFTMWTTK